MSRPKSGAPPKYARHASSGQARVRLRDSHGRTRDYYLGPFGSEESKVKYGRLISEWQANNYTLPDENPADLTIGALAIRHQHHAETYYRRPDGTQTSEVNEFRLTFKLLNQTYFFTPVNDFGPLALKTVRQQMIDAGWCRGVINQRIGRIRRLFRWGVANQYVKTDTLQALEAVADLQMGRSQARESEPIEPVARDVVDATLPFLSHQLGTMVLVQLRSAARPGEVCNLRGRDLDTTKPVWIYSPAQHKMAYRQKHRIIYLGPECQKLLTPFLRPDDPDAYLFSPREARAAFDAHRKLNRKTPMTPSQARRKPKKNPQRRPGDRYSISTYAHAIERACKRAGVPHWHPNQLRHTAATTIANEHGIELAQPILGHSDLATTQIYAEPNHPGAQKLMGEIG